MSRTQYCIQQTVYKYSQRRPVDQILGLKLLARHANMLLYFETVSDSTSCNLQLLPVTIIN